MRGATARTVNAFCGLLRERGTEVSRRDIKRQVARLPRRLRGATLREMRQTLARVRAEQESPRAEAA